jgi:glucosamine-6-phosphate isomerase
MVFLSKIRKIMQSKILKNYEEMSQVAAEEIIKSIKSNPKATLCFASGDTPKRTCEIFVERIKNEGIDISKCTFIGLDEWIGIPPENEGSCTYFLMSYLIKPLNLSPNQYHLFNSDESKSAEECRKIDEVINRNGGLDCILVGIGLNGHIGLNEPNIPFTNYCHVSELAQMTIDTGQKYFNSTTKLTKGITVGLQHLMEAKKAILIANGTKKAPIMKAVFEAEINNQIPATIMRTHDNGLILMDENASPFLSPSDGGQGC